MRNGTVSYSRIMRVKSVVLGVFCAAGVVGVAIFLGVGHQARVDLEEENEALRQQVDQMGALVAENERLSNLVAQASQAQSLPEDQLRELLRLRGEVSALRRQGKAIASPHIENRQAPVGPESGAPAAENWPKESWAFAGYATPSAALQTSLWAASRGDATTFLHSVTGDAQKMAEALLAGKSQSEISAAVAAQFAGVKSFRVVSSEMQNDDTVVLTTASEEQSGTVTKKALLKKVGDEWKLAGAAQ
jgi:hypothetical protein